MFYFHQTSSLTYVGISQQQVGRHQFHRCGSVRFLRAAQVELGCWQSLLMFSLREFALCRQPANLNQLLLTQQHKPGSMSMLVWLFSCGLFYFSFFANSLQLQSYERDYKSCCSSILNHQVSSSFSTFFLHWIWSVPQYQTQTRMFFSVQSSLCVWYFFRSTPSVLDSASPSGASGLCGSLAESSTSSQYEREQANGRSFYGFPPSRPAGGSHYCGRQDDFCYSHSLITLLTPLANFPVQLYTWNSLGNAYRTLEKET